ncbi:MAG TPA: 16S rRNA (adenine(1518)-N(6)/adenine(1519)-N(6))-dimethyltransferase RsmA [Anaerolineae bacterium]|nr:16S rRNA (adenine(1518)-N(6)/adenine(1519)-N(6))-dimethyltransferase RsmA [Anaerolineae bacterium]
MTPPLLLAFEQAMPRSSSSRSRSQGSLREQHTPRKRFGQHFLADRNIVNKIVRTAELEPSSVVLEIGPGLGHLTRALAQAGAQVVAVEVDRELAARLRTEFAETPNVHIVEGDVLTQAPIEWLREAGRQPPYIVVANLPYYITSAILRYLLEAPIPPTRLVVMVQREVAQQIVAQPPHLNLLAVSVQFYGTPRLVDIVPAGAFYPRPKVDSAILRVDVTPRRAAIDSARFFQLVRAGFGAKRKQLRNALANGLALTNDQAAALLQRAGIDPTRRAETLTLDDWERLERVF